MKVLVLSCSTGEGHNSAAKAIVEELNRQKIKNTFKDALTFGNKESEKLIKGFFNSVATSTPSLFGIMYKAGSKISNPVIKSPIYLANLLYANNFYKYIIDNKFDTIICTHLFPMETLTYLKRKHILTAKVYSVLTDYTIIPFLEETELDGYFISSETLTKRLTNSKIPRKKIHPYGIPVLRKYTIKYDKQQCREILKLPKNKSIIMIMTGGIGCGNITNMINAIKQDIDKEILILVLTGKNIKLKETIDSLYNENVMTISFTDKVEKYMDACDVLLSKPGGLSSTEAAVKKVPLIHTMPIPGCETENADFFNKRGMSIKIKNLKELTTAINTLLTSKSKRESMIKKQTKINNFASKDIIDYIVKNS